MKNNIFCFTLGVCVGVLGLLGGVWLSEEYKLNRW